MAEITLPDLSLLWASAGDILQPSDSKIQQGWAPEIPPRQWFNWLDNRQDQAIAHIAQHGIPVWSDAIEYQAGKSYTQGSDGVVYKCLITNTNINPVGDVSGTWRTAWLDSTTTTGPSVATAAQSRAQTDNTVFLSPLQLANAFTGTNQSTALSGWQKLPGGILIQWGSLTVTTANTQTAFSYPTPFTTTVFKTFFTPLNSGTTFAGCQGVSTSLSGGTLMSTIANTTVSFFAIGI